MKERIFTTKEQGRVLVEAGLPISTAIGFRDKYLDQLHSMEDDAGRVGLIEAVTTDVFNPVWDVGTLMNLLPYEIDGSTLECYKLKHAWSVTYRDIDEIPKRSYKYRMYPNKTQEELLAKTFGCVRVIWNACVDSFNSYDKETNPNPKFPTKSDLVIEKLWLNEVSAATLQQKQRDFIEFSRQYFNKNRKEKLGKPNYKNKHDNQSFRLPFPKFKITNNKIRIEKIGWVKIVIDRGVPDNARFISCTVSKNRAGQYFVSVLVETEQCYKQKTSKTVGVDLGIKTLATLSDGIAVENPHFLRENQAKLKRMQRHLSRKKLGSNRRNKCRLKVSRLHRDIANKRSWYMHNLTTMLVNNYDVICIENLNASGMLQNHKLAGSVYDASFSMFRNQLEYKCRWYGKELIVIDRFYPSSKTCSRCGWKNKDLKLSDRTFVCKNTRHLLQMNTNTYIREN